MNRWKKVADSLLKINCVLAIIAAILFFFAWASNAEAIEEIKVMVIDTGIGPHKYLNSYVEYDDSDNYQDDVGHGTHVTGIILFGDKNRFGKRFIMDPVCHKVKIHSCKISKVKGDLAFFTDDKDEIKREIACIKRATAEGFHIINISAGGIFYSQEEYDALKEFTERNGIVFAAAGNFGKDLSKLPFYPASYGIGGVKTPKLVYVDKLERGRFKKVPVKVMVDKFTPLKNIIVVQMNYPTSNRAPAAVTENGVDIYSTKPNNEYGTYTGTSQATPAFLHKFLQYACKKLEK